MEDTTTSADIFAAVMKAFERFGIDLYTIYGVETDVAWSMSGTWVCRSIEVYLPRVKTQWQQRYFSLWSFNSEICANSLKINTLASGRNLEFSRQNNQIARGFAQEFIWSGKRCIPSQRLKRCGKSSSLHSKKSFWFGMRIFGGDMIYGGLQGHLGPLYLTLGANS